jgi:hypothetical protein
MAHSLSTVLAALLLILSCIHDGLEQSDPYQAAIPNYIVSNPASATIMRHLQHHGIRKKRLLHYSELGPST